MMMWCKICGKPVRRVGGAPLLPASLQKVVHEETGLETGTDGHVAMPTDEDPEMRREADAIEADYDGKFRLSVRFGFFRADVANVPQGVTAPHYTAPTGPAMRRQLNQAVAAERWDQSRGGAS